MASGTPSSEHWTPSDSGSSRDQLSPTSSRRSAPAVKGVDTGSRHTTRFRARQRRGGADGPITALSGRDWWALAALSIPVLLMSIDFTVLMVAVPALSRDLNPSATELLWILDIYGVFLAGLLILMGALGDRIGRRRLLMAGAAAFGAASILSAFAWSTEALLVGRALLGIAGATLMPSTLALIRTLFPDPHRRRRALAVWTAAFAGGTGIGPVLGGFMLEHYWWGAVFLVNVPIMAVLLLAAPRLLPESKDPDPGPFDLFSAMLLLSAVVAVMVGIKAAGEHGLTVVPILLQLSGVAIAIVFVHRQRRLSRPLIDVSLFRSIPFTMAVVVNVIAVFAIVGLYYFLPQYVQIVLRRSPFEAGMWAAPKAVGAITGALLAPVVARRLSTGAVIGTGLACAAAGYLVLSAMGPTALLLAAVIGGVLLGGGGAMADTLTNDIIIGTAPAEKSGAAAGISETAYELGGVLGTAVLGTIGTHVYRQHLAANIPAGTPASVAEKASRTLAAASDATMSLPKHLRPALTDASHTAFVHAMAHTFRIAAIVVGVTGFAAWALLRNGAQTGGQESGDWTGSELTQLP